MDNKFIKLMADYSSSGVWSEEGYNMDLFSIPISDTLKFEITSWCDWYEKNDDYLSEEMRKSKFPINYFSEEGLKIAIKIKKELPEWTIIYYDESKQINYEIPLQKNVDLKSIFII